jgi:hypothetical protein
MNMLLETSGGVTTGTCLTNTRVLKAAALKSELPVSSMHLVGSLVSTFHIQASQLDHGNSVTQHGLASHVTKFECHSFRLRSNIGVPFAQQKSCWRSQKLASASAFASESESESESFSFDTLQSGVWSQL